MSDEFRQAIEQVKLRCPIEDVVRERVPALRRAGALWVACCPFHEEKTPSFKVDPRRGTWHCYGACSTGGDQISFVERSYNVEFREALDILASRAGVALPERRNPRRDQGENEPLYEALRRAEEFYRRQLHGEAGKAALAYLRGRGLEAPTLDAFGVGFAPRGVDALASRAMKAGISAETLASAGLVRRDSLGRLRDFFQDRITFPVRDPAGRTVGFGARRLSDGDPRVPKYVNTPETPLFRKGQLIYGLDRAMAPARASSELCLVEGYTDVMAAHQAGISTVVAVLGTATTDEHAALVRRAGVRRVALVFDGDEAGRRATHRALHGLLPLDLEIRIVRLPGEEDPCDFLVREGRGPFRDRLEAGTAWFEFLVREIEAQAEGERWRGIDRALELVLRLRRPLERDERVVALARALSIPVEGMRAQFESLPERRRQAVTRRGAPGPAAGPEAPPIARRAWEELVGAALIEPALAPRLAPLAPGCPDGELLHLIEAILEVHRRDGTGAGIDAVLVELGEHPVRNRVVPILEEAAGAEEPRMLFEGAARFLGRQELDRRIREQAALVAGDQAGPGDHAGLEELHRRLRARVT